MHSHHGGSRGSLKPAGGTRIMKCECIVTDPDRPVTPTIIISGMRTSTCIPGIFTFPPDDPSMLVDLSAVDAGAGYPLPIFGKDTGYLVDIDLPVSPFPPQDIDFACNGKRLLAHDECVEICIERRPVPVVERLDRIGSQKTLGPDETFKCLFPFLEGTYRMDFPGCKRIRGQSDDDRSVTSGEFKGPCYEPLMAIVEGVEGTPDHNLHCA